MSYSNLSEAQIIKTVYDSGSDALKVKGTAGTLVTEAFDYISGSYPSSTQEVYTYKLGGAGGTTVATVTVNYTDSSKSLISNVTKT